MLFIWPHRALNAEQNQSWEFDILNFCFARRQMSRVARQTTPNQNQMVIFCFKSSTNEHKRIQQKLLCKILIISIHQVEKVVTYFKYWYTDYTVNWMNKTRKKIFTVWQNSQISLVRHSIAVKGVQGTS